MKDRYIVFKGSGGLAHMLFGLCDAIEIANRTNRHLIIDCQSAPAFRNRFDKYFYIADKTLNYSCSFDRVPDSLEYLGSPVSQLKETPVKYKSEKYYLDDQDVTFRRDRLGRPTTAIQSGDLLVGAGPSCVTKKSLRYLFSFLIAAMKMNRPPQPVNELIKVHHEIKRQIEKEFDLEGEFIALHFRNTDLANDASSFFPKIRQAMNLYPIDQVVLATDDHAAFALFSDALPECRFFQYTKPQNFNGENIHYHSDDPEKQIFLCLLDVYILLKSSVFIPSVNSGLSRWVTSMVKDGQNLFDIRSNVKKIIT